jgi:tartrate dehydratase beta subunit/fumarate hydratase class I family protein
MKQAVVRGTSIEKERERMKQWKILYFVFLGTAAFIVLAQPL